MSPQPNRYARAAQALHWITVVAVIAAYSLSPGGREAHVYAAKSDFARTLHESVGMFVLALVIARLIWRFVEQPPRPLPMPKWMLLSSRAVHAALYILLFAIPITAILGAWYEGHALDVFGIGAIRPLFAPTHDTGVQFAKVHQLLGNAILWIGGLHAAAALYHHYIMRDGVLASMVPGLSIRTKR